MGTEFINTCIHSMSHEYDRADSRGDSARIVNLEFDVLISALSGNRNCLSYDLESYRHLILSTKEESMSEGLLRTFWINAIIDWQFGFSLFIGPWYSWCYRFQNFDHSDSKFLFHLQNWMINRISKPSKRIISAIRFSMIDGGKSALNFNETDIQTFIW